MPEGTPALTSESPDGPPTPSGLSYVPIRVYTVHNQRREIQ